MAAGLIGLVVSFIALGVSGAAAWYTRQQAKASHAQAAESHRAADIAELAALRESEASLERRLRESLSFDIRGKDQASLVVTVKSLHPETIASLTITVLPESTEPRMGFGSATDQPRQSVWHVGRLASGTEASHSLADVGPSIPSVVDLHCNAELNGISCSWTVPVKILYPPKVGRLR